MQHEDRTFPADAGIAIGPILFVLAILAILAAVMSQNVSDFGSASVSDRVSADIVSQASLIRTKILECNLKIVNNIYAEGGPANTTDNYPMSDASTPLNGLAVSQLTCPDPLVATSQQGLWNGIRPTVLPQPTPGFNGWSYINTNAGGSDAGTATGGRCIWITPSNGTNNGIIAGLTRAATKFTNQTTCSNAATCANSEVLYNPASASQKFVLWITVPTGTPDSHCLP